MNANIKSILLDYKKWYDEVMATYKFRNPDGYVFITYAGEPIGERYLKRIIDLICERENITHFTPHYLRHTFVTIQLSNKIPVSTVAALIGDTPETIYKVYAHSFEKDEVHASNLMDEIINLSSFEESEEIKKTMKLGHFLGHSRFFSLPYPYNLLNIKTQQIIINVVISTFSNKKNTRISNECLRNF